MALSASVSKGLSCAGMPMKSGAMITARLSLEYDREVFAVPGRATDPNAEGPNHLLFKIVGRNEKSQGQALDVTNLICEKVD